MTQDYTIYHDRTWGWYASRLVIDHMEYFHVDGNWYKHCFYFPTYEQLLAHLNH